MAAVGRKDGNETRMNDGRMRGWSEDEGTRESEREKGKGNDAPLQVLVQRASFSLPLPLFIRNVITSNCICGS